MPQKSFEEFSHQGRSTNRLWNWKYPVFDHFSTLFFPKVLHFSPRLCSIFGIV